MPKIQLETKISASIEIVFDLSRSIDLHKISTKHTKEEAVAGKTSGLIELDEFVTWRAKHFGLTQNLTSKITNFNRPAFFADEMLEGAFKRFRHEHHFKQEGNQTIMIDIFDYESPFGILGKLADFLFLEKYLHGLLSKRNAIIKEFATSEKWKEVLKKA